jgi:hypothetical protein
MPSSSAMNTSDAETAVTINRTIPKLLFELRYDILPDVLLAEDQAGNEQGHGHQRHGSKQGAIGKARTVPYRAVGEP